MSWKLCDFVTTSRVKPSAESWVQISSDYRRWCHALWRQLRLLSTPSRQPAAPGGSGSPSPSAHLVGRRLLSSESVEIKMEEKNKQTFSHLSIFLWFSFINSLLYEAAGLCRTLSVEHVLLLDFAWLPLALMRAWADVSAVGHYLMLRLQFPGHLVSH